MRLYCVSCEKKLSAAFVSVAFVKMIERLKYRETQKNENQYHGIRKNNDKSIGADKTWFKKLMLLLHALVDVDTLCAFDLNGGFLINWDLFSSIIFVKCRNSFHFRLHRFHTKIMVIRWMVKVKLFYFWEVLIMHLQLNYFAFDCFFLPSFSLNINTTG